MHYTHKIQAGCQLECGQKGPDSKGPEELFKRKSNEYLRYISQEKYYFLSIHDA